MSSRHNRCGNASQVTAVGKVQGDEGDLEEVLALAEYEIHIDPYRGLVNYEVPSPWFQCRHTDQACGKVSQVVGCACPSLIRWTREYDKLAGRKKRKRPDRPCGNSAETGHQLGRRRLDPAFNCPCDHNPFCLASLGGVMDDFLAEAAAEMVHIHSLTEFVEPNSSNAQHIISVDDSSEGSAGCEGLQVDAVEAEKSEEGKTCAIDVDVEVQIVSCDITPEAPPKPTLMHGCTSNFNSIHTSKTPAEVFLEDISFASYELDHTDANCILSEVTIEQLHAVRREVQIDLHPLRSFVDNIVLAHPDANCTQAAYIDRIQRFHNSMLFTNPLKLNRPAVDGAMRFAVPPGMKNLGATCYLNTQLQCLARNMAFLDGIFAWRPSKTESRMDSVLSTLQQIMARLTYGVDAICATEEFSKALGLQNDEMQDPNEFARLLFQRMHEAFQQSSLHGNGGEKSSLATLLPTLFEGDMTYQTQCHSCGRITERSEKFMDINLPIVHPTLVVAKGKRGQLQIEEAFSVAKKGDRETTVQFCLEKYMCAEELYGDNQYWCESCASKRDATRRSVFAKLPPVLNLQLCRYVYDRKLQTKKKLTDRVLLPQYLDVKSAYDSEFSRYRLCAVMKHLGSSAYQGHYIAESMDWQTGAWFEFDDEKVSILRNGPTCCPDETNISKNKTKGSQDAYNIYYVQESFLGRCAMHSIASSEMRGEAETIRKLDLERQGRYDVLADMCRNDAEIADRRRRRKRGLLTLLKRSFLADSTCVRFDMAVQAEIWKESVWVDGGGLRSIFSCAAKQDVDDLVHSLLRKDLICEHHVGLEPGIARCGKVVPIQFLDELIELLRTEQRCAFAPSADWSRGGFVLNNISCDRCSESYRATLLKKLEFARSLRFVFQELDPKNDGVQSASDNGNYVYAVSKRWVTKFRKSVTGLLKGLTSSDEIPFGVECLKHYDWDHAMSDDDIDTTVNSAIVCTNGKCCSVNKRLVRHVSEHLWRSINALFPRALRIRKPRSKELEWVMCSECEDATKERETLEKWPAFVTSGLPPELLKGRRKQESVLASTNLTNSDAFFLVHKRDIQRLWESCKLLWSPGTFVASSVKHDLERKMFCQTFSGGDRGPLHERVLRKWVPQSLLCSEHSLVLNPAVLKHIRSQDNDSVTLWRFNDDLSVLSFTEYRHFLRAVIRLHELLFPASHDDDLSSSHGGTDETLDAMCATLSSSFHPRVRAMIEAESCSDDSYTFLTCSIGNTNVEHRLAPAMCADQRCNFDCIEALRAEERLRRRENVIHSNGIAKEENLLPSKVIFDVDDGVQVIDWPAETKSHDMGFCLRIVAMEAKANVDDVISSLRHNDSHDTGIRRSGRKRKQRYQLGGGTGLEQLNLRSCHNFAAVRLLLLEKAVGFKIDQPLILLLNLSAGDGVDDNRVKIDIHSNWNSLAISQVIADATKSLGLSDDDMERVYDDMTIMFHSAEEAHPKRKTARNGEDEAQREAMMESLLQTANLTDRSDVKTETNGTRRVERGFTGTFLQSPFTPAGEADDILSAQSLNGVNHEVTRKAIING